MHQALRQVESVEENQLKLESEKAQFYMAGWRAGYHNATLAERKRITLILKNLTKLINDQPKGTD